MLKGHVFSRQLFENPIFALFINTFLNGTDGVASDYKNAMAVTYSGSTVTVDSGAVCIQGRFLEEDTSTSIAAGTNTVYCKLVIEIDLDKENTESNFEQGYYKIITSSSGYPELTQTNIVKNVSGIYQYELARFKTNANGISDFQDMRTFLDFDSIYAKLQEDLETIKSEYTEDYNSIKSEYEEILEELKEELESVEDGSAYLLKSGGTADGDFIFNGEIVADNIKNSSGSRVVYKDDFAIIEGTILVESGSAYGTVEDISYPTGFTQSNCIVVSVAVNKSSSENISFGFSARSTDWTAGSGLNTVRLCPSKIILVTNNISRDLISGQATGTAGYSSDTTLSYKIVLYKIED